MKKIYTIFLGLLICFGICGCNNQSGTMQLETPLNLRYDNGFLKWSIVENANEYIVAINLDEYKSESNIFDLTKIGLQEGQYTAKVKALGNGVYASSAFSSEITFNYGVSSPENGTKLSTPKNIVYENNTFSWGAVEGASGYAIKINDEEYTTPSTSYVVDLEETCNFTFSIKAVAVEESGYLDSAWSALGTYKFIMDKEEVSHDFKTKVLNSGIGKTVSAIDGKYGEVDAGYSSPFDTSKLNELVIYETPSSTNVTTTKVSADMENIITQISASISESVKIGNTNESTESKKVFKKGFAESFSANYSYDKTNKTKEVIIYMQNNINGKIVEIGGRRNIQTFTKILSQDFLNDIDRIKNCNSDSEAQTLINRLFDSYGTHVVTGGFFGARAEFYYIYSYKSNEEIHKVDASLEVEFTKHMKNLQSANVNVGADFSTTLGWNDEQSEEMFYANLKGGNPIPCVSYQSAIENYSKWLSSFEGGNYDTLVDFPNESLISLWDLLPETPEYENVKKALSETAYKLMDESYSEAVAKFYNVTQEIQDGSKLNPYEISTPSDFEKIRKYDGQNVNFVLTNDINFNEYADYKLKTWNVIESFSGNLDGNGKTISNMYYEFYNGADVDWGLFKTINAGATIKNLNISNGTAKYIAPGVGNAVSEVKFGFLAAFNYGTIENCSFTNNLIDIDSNTKVSNQYSHVGTVVCENNGIIDGCTVSGSIIKLDMDTVSNDSADDKCTVSVGGGICAYNNREGQVRNCTVSNMKIHTNVSYLSDDGEDVKAVSGGIVAFQNGEVSNNSYSGNMDMKATKRYYEAKWGLFGNLKSVDYKGTDNGDVANDYAR